MEAFKPFVFKTEKEKQERETEKVKIFRSYLDEFDLKISDLRNKKILDVGAGSRDFAQVCLERKITDQIYSLEPKLAEVELKKEKQDYNWLGHYWIGKSEKIDKKSAAGIAEELSFKKESFDLVLALESVPWVIFYPAKDEKKMEMSVKEMVRVLKPKGEIRIHPGFFNSKAGIALENEEKYFNGKMEKILEKLRQKKNFEIIIKESADERDVRSLLIIKKLQ